MWGTTYMLSSLNVYRCLLFEIENPFVELQFTGENICRKIRIKAASVYGTATNIFTITSYPGPDPEVSDDPTSVIGGGRDVSTYPTVKSYTLGIRISF